MACETMVIRNQAPASSMALWTRWVSTIPTIAVITVCATSSRIAKNSQVSLRSVATMKRSTPGMPLILRALSSSFGLTRPDMKTASG